MERRPSARPASGNMSSTVASVTAAGSRPSQAFEKRSDEMKPSKSEINWVIMDYLVTEGYPGAAEKFALETNLGNTADIESIKARVQVRNAIHSGQLAEAIGLINNIDPEILGSDQLLHFRLLQLQLIEIIREILTKPGAQLQSSEFLQAISFATDQLAPRAPTDPVYQRALESTMALMIFSEDKMPTEGKELLDVRLREKVATDVNKAILVLQGRRSEAKIRSLVRARAWTEAQAREAKIDVKFSAFASIGLDGGHGVPVDDSDAMVA